MSDNTTWIGIHVSPVGGYSDLRDSLTDEQLEELHITLAYMGEISAIEYQKVATAFCKWGVSALSAIFGGDRYTNVAEYEVWKIREGDTTIALVEFSTNQLFAREGLVSTINTDTPVEVRTDFLFKPHVTLPVDHPVGTMFKLNNVFLEHRGEKTITFLLPTSVTPHM